MTSSHATAFLIDPFLSSVLDPLTAEESAQLKANIRADGKITAPYTVWKERNALVDGHHRDRLRDELIAEGLEIAAPVIEYRSFASEAAAAKWIFEHAVGTRTHFDTFRKIHRLLTNRKLRNLLVGNATARMLVGRPKKGGTTLALPSAKVSKAIAEIVGCSDTTAKEAICVSRHAPLLAEVLAGKFTPHSAYRSIRGHAIRQQNHRRITTNLPKANEHVKTVAAAGGLKNQIHHCDVLAGLSQVPTGSVSAIITSPPYPLPKVKYPEWSYDGDYLKYLAWMKTIWAEWKRVLMTGGKLIVNFDTCSIPPEARNGKEIRRDTRRDFANIAADAGLIWMDEIFWAKQNACGTRPTMGTKGSPAGPRIMNNCEYICIWAKDTTTKAPENATVPVTELIDLTPDEQFRMSLQLWAIKPASRVKTGHRCPYPDEIVRRLIRLYTFLGDTVLDPFAGSGTTPAMAIRMGRHFIAFDNAPEYVELAKKRVAAAFKHPLPPPPVPDWKVWREKRRARNHELLDAMRCSD